MNFCEIETQKQQNKIFMAIKIPPEYYWNIEIFYTYYSLRSIFNRRRLFFTILNVSLRYEDNEVIELILFAWGKWALVEDLWTSSSLDLLCTFFQQLCLSGRLLCHSNAILSVALILTTLTCFIRIFFSYNLRYFFLASIIYLRFFLCFRGIFLSKSKKPTKHTLHLCIMHTVQSTEMNFYTNFCIPLYFFISIIK